MHSPERVRNYRCRCNTFSRPKLGRHARPDYALSSPRSLRSLQCPDPSTQPSTMSITICAIKFCQLMIYRKLLRPRLLNEKKGVSIFKFKTQELIRMSSGVDLPSRTNGRKTHLQPQGDRTGKLSTGDPAGVQGDVTSPDPLSTGDPSGV